MTKIYLATIRTRKLFPARLGYQAEIRISEKGSLYSLGKTRYEAKKKLSAALDEHNLQHA